MQDFLESVLLGFGMVRAEQDDEYQENEDRYDVYVNQNFIGQKTLRNEQIIELDSYLRDQGVAAEIVGNQYTIQVDPANVAEIKGTLEAYLHIR